MATQTTPHNRTIDTLDDLWAACLERGDAVIYQGDTGPVLTARDAQVRWQQFVAYLHTLDAQPGDRVLLQLANGEDFLCAFFASLRCGCRVVLLDRDADPSPWMQDIPGERILGRWWQDQADALCWQAGPACIDTRSGPVALPETGTASPTAGLSHRAAPHDIAVILCTSGSSGAAHVRGVLKSHENLLAEVRDLYAVLGTGTFLSMLPWPYIYGLLHHVLLPLYGNGHIRYLSRYTPAELLGIIADERIDVFVSVPAIYRLLVQGVAEQPASSLRWAVTSGAPLDQATVLRVQSRLHWPLIEFYGSTETGGICVNENKSGSPHTVGRPLPRIEISNGEPPGRSGVVRVRGRTVSDAAIVDGVLTPLVDVDGWYDTGDIGVIDNDGSLQLQGRAARIIKMAGRRVSLDEIESRLLEHPAIVDVLVRPIGNRLHGEAAAADIVLTDQHAVTEQQLLQWCREQLPPHLRPRSLHCVTRIPRVRAGKADLRASRDR